MTINSKDDQLKALQEENERLRSALAQIADWDGDKTAQEMFFIARKAMGYATLSKD